MPPVITGIEPRQTGMHSMPYKTFSSQPGAAVFLPAPEITRSAEKWGQDQVFWIFLPFLAKDRGQ